MGTSFHGVSPWPHITEAIRTKGRRYAAIAYLGEDAPNLLPFRRGDVLVVNAGKAALRAHATSPTALEHYVEKGVIVMSSPKLHAKVIATDRKAVIGSANASHNSTVIIEAVAITDDPDLITSVRKFIDEIDETTEVDATFLNNAAAEWRLGRAVNVPGVTGRLHTEPDFLPSPVTRLFLWNTAEYEPSATEQREWTAQRRRHRRSAGPTAKYQLDWFRLEESGILKTGDVIVQFDDDNWIYPPAVVHSDAIAVPRSRGAVAYFLRTRLDLAPLHMADAESALANLGHPHHRMRNERRILSPRLRSDLLKALETLTTLDP